MKLPQSFEELIESLKKLPGVGTKSAERMAYQILNFTEDEVKDFATALIQSNRAVLLKSPPGRGADRPMKARCGIVPLWIYS